MQETCFLHLKYSVEALAAPECHVRGSNDTWCMESLWTNGRCRSNNCRWNILRVVPVWWLRVAYPSNRWVAYRTCCFNCGLPTRRIEWMEEKRSISVRGRDGFHPDSCIRFLLLPTCAREHRRVFSADVVGLGVWPMLRAPNKPMNPDSQKLRSFVAPLSAAGYGQRYIPKGKVRS